MIIKTKTEVKDEVNECFDSLEKQVSFLEVLREPINEYTTFEEYSTWKKYSLLTLVALAGAMDGFASTIYIPAVVQIREDFNTSQRMVDLSISVFLLFLGITPLIWGNLSDTFGRRTCLVISLILFTISNVGCALSTSIQMLIGMRVIQAISASAGTVIGIGAITDIFEKDECGTALGLFFLGPMIGPIIGPVVGGYVSQGLGWRSSFWVCTGYGFALLASTLLFLPETLKAKVQPPLEIQFKPKFKIVRQPSKFNPLLPLTFINYPIIVIVLINAAIHFGCYIGVETVQPLVLSKVYDLTPEQIGLSLIPMGVGDIVGSVVTGKISDILAFKCQRKDVFNPEARLLSTLVGGVIAITSYFLFGWMVHLNYPIYVNLIWQFFLGLSMTNIVVATSSYLVALFPDSAASVSSCSSLFRFAISSLLSSFSSEMLEGLNIQWYYSLFGFLCFFGYILIILTLLFGFKFRYSKLFPKNSIRVFL